MGGSFPPWPSNQCSTTKAAKNQAVLRYISGGTSYYQIRLAFHPLSKVTRRGCTTFGSGLLLSFRPASSCPGQDHLVSGIYPMTSRPFRLAFASPSCLTVKLAIEKNSLPRFSKRTLDSSYFRKPYPTNYSYQVSGFFHLLSWILFRFPSPYYFAIGLNNI